MAERRMFTKKITDDDNFMGLSSSAQALYLHLSMAADDDGFCNQVSVSMFKAHASAQDLQALLENRYIYQFDNGVIVIKHWRMANALRKDRYTPTAFQEELKQLGIKENGSYTWLPNGCQVVAEWLPQDSIGKDSIDKNNNGVIHTAHFDEFVSAYPKKTHNILQLQEAYTSELIRRADIGEADLLAAARNYAEAVKIKNTNEQYIKSPVKFITDGTYIDYLSGNYKRPAAKVADQKPKQATNTFNQFEEKQTYDYEALEKMLGIN